MSDTQLQTYIRYGTDAQRLAFTPDPPTISGSAVQVLYVWYVSSGSGSGNVYVYDTAWHQVASGVSPSAITALTGDVTASGPGSVAATLAIPLTNNGNSGTALTIDLASKARGEHRFTLTGNVTLTLSNPVDGGSYVLLIDTGAGGFTVTWPAAVLWPGGTAPTITATASKTDLVTLIYRSDTGKYLGSFNQNY